jgi:hypothetical protein
VNLDFCCRRADLNHPVVLHEPRGELLDLDFCLSPADLVSHVAGCSRLALVVSGLGDPLGLEFRALSTTECGFIKDGLSGVEGRDAFVLHAMKHVSNTERAAGK